MAGRAKELAEHLLVPFASSERPLVTLFMDVIAPAHGGPWPAVLIFHGWHQDLSSQRERARAFASKGFCALNLNLRGRAGTTGEPDANGWEIRDAWDALFAARHSFPQLCSETHAPHAFGASGGGGNVYALLGKSPDLCASAVAWCGISDYARWFEWNEAGNYRDEMEKWIAPSPRTNPEAFASRSGVTVARNRLAPLRIVHGIEDDCVPVEHARAYHGAPPPPGEPALLEYAELPGVGHDIPEAELERAAAFFAAHPHPVYVPQHGNWCVAGFLKTHYFEARWDHIGRVGSLDIDLRRRRLRLECPHAGAAQVRLAGPVRKAELVEPLPKAARILALRQDHGWSVLDIRLDGQPACLRWTVG